MANVSSIQVVLDGPRHTTIKAEGILDTSDLASTVLADVATLWGNYNNTAKAKTFRVMHIRFNVEDGLAVNLSFNGATPARIEELTGRGEMKFHEFGGIPDNSTTPNGQILISTQGWSTGAILSFSLTIDLVKVLQ